MRPNRKTNRQRLMEIIRLSVTAVRYGFRYAATGLSGTAATGASGPADAGSGSAAAAGSGAAAATGASDTAAATAASSGRAATGASGPRVWRGGEEVYEFGRVY